MRLAKISYYAWPSACMLFLLQMICTENTAVFKHAEFTPPPFQQKQKSHLSLRPDGSVNPRKLPSSHMKEDTKYAE